MLHGSDGGLEGTRLDDGENGFLHGPVGGEAAERDAGAGAVIDRRSAAVVADDPPVGAAVADVKPAAATPAPKQPREERSALARSTAAHGSLHLHVLSDPLLVRPIPLPPDVALVMLGNQDGPLVLRHPDPPASSRPAVHDRGFRAGPPVRVGARVNGIGEDLVQRAVDRKLPDHAPAEGTVLDAGKLDSFLPEPEKDLPDAPQFLELLEHERDARADPPVRVHLAPVAPGPEEPDGKHRIELSAFGLLAKGHQRPLAHHPELPLAHGALETQQQPVVEVVGIVDPFGVDDQRRRQSAQVDQMVPVPIVAGQTRGLEGEHRTHLLQADRGHQPLESGTLDPPRSGPSQVLVHHLHPAPAQSARAVPQFVLPTPALQVLLHLAERRLADVDVRRSLKVLRRDLGRGHETSSPACEPSRRTTCSPRSRIQSSSTFARTSGERVSQWMQPNPRGRNGCRAFMATLRGADQRGGRNRTKKPHRNPCGRQGDASGLAVRKPKPWETRPSRFRRPRPPGSSTPGPRSSSRRAGTPQSSPRRPERGGRTLPAHDRIADARSSGRQHWICEHHVARPPAAGVRHLITGAFLSTSHSSLAKTPQPAL